MSKLNDILPRCGGGQLRAPRDVGHQQQHRKRCDWNHRVTGQ
jgi:hypothetical protein